MPILSAINIIKKYQQYDNIVNAVNRASFDAEEGEFIAIIGTSGSGKSTLLNICAGLDTADSGQVIVRGKDITKMNNDELCRYRGKMIGYVFQSHKLVPYLTALENITLPLAAADRDPYKHEERLKLLIDKLSLGNRLHHLPSELSGGQQQRIAIARALIHYPQILCADEPTGNLDKQSAEDVMDLLINLKNDLKQTLIIVTHDPDIANRADRVLKMDNGVLSVRVTPSDLR